ncbi:cysteine-rich receptor-like protein kinase 44 [Daucus carota subsp. sativus]|nr:PREDICTED: putative receptor-like protein kinase At4g00960 [Daucus carota subsp. sativus]
MMVVTSSRILVFTFCIFIGCISVSWSKYIIHSCGTSGNYTSNSTYEKNLDRALATLSIAANLSNSGFYNASVGEDQDRVNTIVLCRKDFQPDVCRSCVNDSIIRLKELCPDQNEAVGWYDECTLRYSNRVILNNIETLPAWSYYNSESATDVAQFDQDLQKLLSNLKVQAAGKKFATGNVSGPDFLTIWGLMQCTPDLSSTQCSDCLDTVTEQIPLCCSGKIGRQIFNPSCKLIYDIRHFFNEISPVNAPPPRQQLSPPSPPSVIPGRDKNTKRTVLITAVVVSGLAMLLIVLFCIFRRKTKHRINTETVHHGSVEDIISIESFQYDFGMVESATKSFSDSNKLGEGGFGAVYKGTLENGQEVAVKRLSSGSVQGEQEFKNEIILVARLQHRNLVRLLGFSFKGTERLLIYEFVPNASLDHLIFDLEKRSYLDWEKRYKIIGGVARGLLYLHEDSRLRIIHRDLKAGNILLDGEMNPKIADFGMARLFNLDETQGMTNRIVGTYGYMAPEYALYGQFSVKSDVFSFGVLLLEIVSGRKNYSFFQNGENTGDLASFAWKNWRQGTASKVIDPVLRNSSGSVHEMMRCIHIGLLCVQEDASDRPTMASVVLMLNSFSLTLAVPSEPAFYMKSIIVSEISRSWDSTEG